MLDDPIVHEIRQIREKIAAQYDYDVKAIGHAMQDEQRRSRRKTVSLPPKRLPAALVAKRKQPRRPKAVSERA